MIRVANSGISGVIDAYGRVLKRLPLNTQGVIDTKLPQAAHQKTLYAQYGVVPIFVIIISLLCYIVINWKYEVKRKYF